MEISILPNNGLKLKGKTGVILYNSIDKASNAAAVIIPEQQLKSMGNPGEMLVLQGPGEYEITGIKISGTRANAENTVYSLTIDNIDLVLGQLADLEKVQNKLKEHQIAVIDTNVAIDASFATGLGTNSILFFGEKAQEVVKGLGKESVKTAPKYAVTAEKLPVEIETVLLEE